MHIRDWVRTDGLIVMFAIFFILILHGCTEVTVKCGPGMQMTDKDDPTFGGCTAPFVNWVGQSADGFTNSATGAQIPAGSGLTCSAAGSVKCRTATDNPAGPGKCGLVSCKSWYKPSTNKCFCDCYNPGP